MRVDGGVDEVVAAQRLMALILNPPMKLVA